MSMNDYEAAKRATAAEIAREAVRKPIWGEGSCIAAPATISPPRETSEIERLINTQENAIADLMLTIDQLRQRLAPVLLEPMPCKETGGKVSPVMSMVGARINGHNEQLWSQVVRLRNLMDELAV